MYLEKDRVFGKGPCIWKRTMYLEKDHVFGKRPCIWKRTMYLEKYRLPQFQDIGPVFVIPGGQPGRVKFQDCPCHFETVGTYEIERTIHFSWFNKIFTV